ncbi:MAG: T9SS type A sorting domain-containing protein, partial [Bacteroidia bacterium]
MRKKILLATLFTISSLVLIHPYVFTSSSGAPSGNTGAPGETTCAQNNCHAGNPINELGGELGIKVLDNGTEVNEFINGKIYTVEVTLAKADAAAFGFQVTAKGTKGGAGTLATGGNLDVKKVLTYITHKNATPLENGKDKWTCQWTAPASGAGDVTFYAAGNAVDGNGNTAGDYIYTTSKKLVPSSVSVDENILFVQNLRMYPNPVQNVLAVEFTSHENKVQNALLEVYSMDGKLLKTEIQAAKAFLGNTIYADLSGYKKGTYLVRISVGENSVVKKIL